MKMDKAGRNRVYQAKPDYHLKIDEHNYDLYAVTVHDVDRDHFFAAIADGTGKWIIYDGLSHSLHFVRRLKLGKKQTVEHVVYKKT